MAAINVATTGSNSAAQSTRPRTLSAPRARRPEDCQMPALLTLRCASGLDRFFCLRRLLTHIIGNVRQIALVWTDRRQIVQLADEIQRPQRLPHLFSAGIDHRNFGASHD